MYIYFVHPQPRLRIDSDFTARRHNSVRIDNVLHIFFGRGIRLDHRQP